MITIKINPDINDMVTKTAIVVVVTTKASCSELGDCDFKPAMLRRYFKYSTVQLKLVGGGGGGLKWKGIHVSWWIPFHFFHRTFHQFAQ